MELYAASELYKTKRSGAGFEADTLTSYQPKSQQYQLWAWAQVLK